MPQHPQSDESLDPAATLASDEAPPGPIDVESPAMPSNPPEPDALPDVVQAAREDALKIRDQLLRTAADFDNFKKRARRDLQDAERVAREDFLRDLLPVFDNLERATQHAGTATDVKSLAQGIELVMRQFVDTLSRLGVERIQALGQPFDPALHEAVQQQETLDEPPGTVLTEIQAGYRIGDRLVRPAMVVVARPPSS